MLSCIEQRASAAKCTFIALASACDMQRCVEECEQKIERGTLMMICDQITTAAAAFTNHMLLPWRSPKTCRISMIVIIIFLHQYININVYSTLYVRYICTEAVLMHHMTMYIMYHARVYEYSDIIIIWWYDIALMQFYAPADISIIMRLLLRANVYTCTVYSLN